MESGARHSNDFPRPHSLADEARLLKTRTVALTECNALRLRTDSLELTARDFERWLPNDFPVGHSLDMASCASRHLVVRARVGRRADGIG